MPYRYKYPRPALSVDCVVFGLDGDRLKLLLIERGQPPFEGCWALPGGFVEMDETLEQAARRELAEETGLRDVPLEQLHAFSAVDRDPRERVVSVAHYALVKLGEERARPASDASDAAWFGLRAVPTLAFDHAEILRMALERLRRKPLHRPIGLELLPNRFSLSQLQRLYETVLGRALDERSFREKLLASGLLVESDQLEPGGARLYRFDRRKYRTLMKSGFNLEI